ncbi:MULTISPECIES: COQ9 family protein [Halocynthiibacter]|uniref:COQ9 family protein n=1 Tax=Halocynthiibacter halioticoli TaxID=2986804 RepID=A0AAE3LU97_9RHOB|nr:MULTISPECIES: COQ9 family protein [Halocynthiibacter]MCV6823320.1 COQ9 family protein [Halocynthiibacter halioticoli]MCW4056321.1 COQ9 family protein [Halocynthiibacter sp. SDUM655004]
MSGETTGLKEQLLAAAIPHVVFDGWSEATLAEAAKDAGVDPAVAKELYPNAGVDLAAAFHKAGDQEMLRRIAEADMAELRFRDKIAFAVRLRIEAVEDKDAVRKGSALFALPQNAGTGSKLVWGTCDAIWNALGDTSDDVNWYTKRATLSGVYGSTVLYWLGDDSPDSAATWAFLDRRIENVMQFEKLKANVRKHPVLSRLWAGPAAVLSGVKAPRKARTQDLPGTWAPQDTTE